MMTKQRRGRLSNSAETMSSASSSKSVSASRDGSSSGRRGRRRCAASRSARDDRRPRTRARRRRRPAPAAPGCRARSRARAPDWCRGCRQRRCSASSPRTKEMRRASLVLPRARRSVPMRKPLVPRAGDPGSSSRTTVAIRSSTWSRAITVAAAVTINQSAARSSSSELERFLVPPLMMRACVSAARRRPSAPQKRVASGDRWRELPQTPIVRGENSLPWIIAAVPRSARAGSFAAAAVIRRITRRYGRQRRRARVLDGEYDVRRSRDVRHDLRARRGQRLDDRSRRRLRRALHRRGDAAFVLVAAASDRTGSGGDHRMAGDARASFSVDEPGR